MDRHLFKGLAKRLKNVLGLVGVGMCLGWVWVGLGLGWVGVGLHMKHKNGPIPSHKASQNFSIRPFDSKLNFRKSIL